MRIARPLVFVLLAAACGEPSTESRPATRPPLPPLRFRPMLAELQQLAASRARPDERTTKELQEYAGIALQRVEADERTAAVVQRALLDSEFAWVALEPALADEQIAIRRRAAWLCGISRQPVLQVPLLLRLKYELDPGTVIWVADALAKLGNDTGLMWLAAAFQRQETAQEAGRMAIEALRARGVTVPPSPSWDDLRRLLEQQDARWRATGRTSLPDATRPAERDLDPLLAQHLQTPEGTQLRPVDDARYVLTRLGALGVPMLAKTLQAEEHYLRMMPLQVLADLGPAAKDAVPAIVPLLGDPLTASTAVRALGEIGAKDQLPHLRPLLADVDTELRAMAAQAVGLLDDQDSQAALAALLADDQEGMDVRVRAAFGLCCLGENPRAMEFLQTRLDRGDYHQPTLTHLLERLAARDR